MTTQLPAVAALVFTEAVDSLPARLRKRLDDMTTRAAAWPVTIDGDHATVRVDDDTTVTLTITDGTLREGAHAHCSCLLAPNCLHRAAVLARCPVQADDPAAADAATADAAATDLTTADPGVEASASASAAPTPAAGETMPASTDATPGGEEPTALTPVQQKAVAELWHAATAVLRSGRHGSGAVHRAALLRASHQARAHGLHRAAAVSRTVAAQLHASHTTQPQFRLADLTDAMRELLDLTHQLTATANGAPDGASEQRALLGTARRAYDAQGSLRVVGLCSVPILTESGHAGVITYLSDPGDQLWAVADLRPGPVTRAATAGDHTVAVGESALTHRKLARAGLIISGATASASGQLGAGKSVRAVRAAGATWHEEPLASQWRVPFADQVHRAFEALTQPVQDRPVGADLLFLRVRLTGAHHGDVHAITDDGIGLTLTVASDHPELPYRENLRVLGMAVGARILLVARPDPARVATVEALAVATADPAVGDSPVGGASTVDAPTVNDARLVLPDAWGGHADLGYDQLNRSHLRQAPSGLSAPSDPPVDSGPPATSNVDLAAISLPVAPSTTSPADPALRLVRRHVERVVDGGRAVQALAGRDEHRLRAARLVAGADLLATLTDAARLSTRDPFGRLVDDDSRGFAQAWLAFALYEQAAALAFAEASWCPMEARTS